MTIPDWILEAAAEIAGLRAYNTEHFNYPEFEQQVAEVIQKHWPGGWIFGKAKP